MIRTKSTLIQVVQTVVETDTETVVQHFNPNGDLIMQASTPKALPAKSALEATAQPEAPEKPALKPE